MLHIMPLYFLLCWSVEAGRNGEFPPCLGLDGRGKPSSAPRRGRARGRPGAQAEPAERRTQGRDAAHSLSLSLSRTAVLCVLLPSRRALKSCFRGLALSPC